MRRCLIVDDSRVVRSVARRFVEAMGFSVDEADDGQRAVTACEQQMPDVVLLD
ncbi:response regulator, partial [Bradyrhizobium sp.]|uniref:response regulator n=1 Tax=Bradyrhizobium sp. TaxID=376 RepID=UPI003C49EEDA